MKTNTYDRVKENVRPHENERPSELFKRYISRERPQEMEQEKAQEKAPTITKTVTTKRKDDIMMFVRLVQKNRLDVL